MWTIFIQRTNRSSGWFARWLCVSGFDLAFVREDASGFPTEEAAERKAQLLRGYPENKGCLIYPLEYK